jgi:hypothetical protein
MRLAAPTVAHPGNPSLSLYNRIHEAYTVLHIRHDSSSWILPHIYSCLGGQNLEPVLWTCTFFDITSRYITTQDGRAADVKDNSISALLLIDSIRASSEHENAST